MSDPGKAVFLSYASQDAEAAKRIADALRSSGIEVWFDAEGGLEHGDEWDAKIRRQIKECVLFIPIISANTEAREEGYFRIEWELAAQRSLGIASGVAFILPVVVDDTKEPEALVPDRFRTVQWTRARAGELTSDQRTKFVKLWSHRAGVLKQQGREQQSREQGAGSMEQETAVGGALRPDGLKESGHKAPPTNIRPPWLIPAIAAVAILAAFGAWQLLRSPPASGLPPAVSQSNPPPASAAPSEARKLSNRARAMSLDKYDSSIDDYTAAEGLVKKALELDPNDAEIWAVSSLLNFGFNSRGFERSGARVAAARANAERALKLDPNSTEALFALGRWQRDNEEPALAEATLRRVLARNPDHAGALHNLGYLLDRMNRLDEAAALYAREARNPTAAPLASFTEYLMYFRRGRFPEADVAVRKSIAAEPSANSQSGLALLLLTWKGDAEAAAAAVATGPVTIRREHRPIWVTAFANLCRRKPAEALRALERLSDEFILDNWYTGPKGYWVGLAYAQMGREEAARVAWEAGLAVVDQRLRAAPANYEVRLARGELLALLGREPEALQEARTVEEIVGRDTIWIFTPARILAALGRTNDVLPLLERQLQFTRENRNSGWALTPALLRIDPRWDKIRSDPRFKKLCEEAVAAPATAPAFPQDPDLAKAMALVETLNSTMEDHTLAEDFAKGVLARKPTDPEAVIVSAYVANRFILRGFDVTEERHAAARRLCERALLLAPDHPEALHVLGQFLTFRSADLPRAVELLRRAVALQPDRARFYNSYIEALEASHAPDAVRAAREAAARFPADPIIHYRLALTTAYSAGDLESYEKALDETLAIGPVATAVIRKSAVVLTVHRDIPGTREVLTRIPESFRLNDRAVYAHYVLASASGEAADVEDAIRMLNALPGGFLNDFGQWPKRMLVGDLYARLGNAPRARQEYEAALADIERAPDGAAGKFARARRWILVGLGRTTEAREQADLISASVARPFNLRGIANLWFNPIATLLVVGEREKALELLREAMADEWSRRVLAGTFAVDPHLAAFRDDPEVKAILAQPAKGK